MGNIEPIPQSAAERGVLATEVTRQRGELLTVICDQTLRILSCSERADNLIGPVIGTSGNFPEWRDLNGNKVAKGTLPTGLIKLKLAGTSGFWVFATSSSNAEKITIQLIDAQDIGERFAKMSYQESIWRNAIESAGHGVWDYNTRNEVMFVSDAWRHMRGFTLDQSLDNDYEHWIDRLHPDDRENCVEQVRRHNEGEVDQFSFEYRERHTAGHYVWIHCSGRVVEWSEDGSARRVIGTDIDITRIKEEEQKRVEELKDAQQKSEAARLEAQRLSKQDPLTLLPNRRVFSEEIEQLTSNGETSKQFAVMIIDLDRFKPVNDLYGHSAGDVVLQTAANRLQGSIGMLGTVTRLGGDEFGVILVPGSTDIVQSAKACADAIVMAMNQPIKIGDFTVEIGASVGVALFPEHGTDPSTLFRNADMALYAVKQSERGSVKFYCNTIGFEAEAKAVLENAARHAVANEEIIPYFQPVFDLRTGSIQSFEVLARWRSDELGNISPNRFIPIVDQFNLMAQFTLPILRQACEVAKSWPDEISLAINLTAKEVCDLSTPIRFFKLLSMIGFPPNRLKIEVTEQALLKDLFSAKQVISSFRNAGVKIVLDDFGTGYAGLGYLRELKLDGIKIDRSFISNMVKQPESATIVEAMQGLAIKLGLETVAEGIEDQATLYALRRIGCKTGQGFLFAPAVSAETAIRLVQNEGQVLRKLA